MHHRIKPKRKLFKANYFFTFFLKFFMHFYVLGSFYLIALSNASPYVKLRKKCAKNATNTKLPIIYACRSRGAYELDTFRRNTFCTYFSYENLMASRYKANIFRNIEKV